MKDELRELKESVLADGVIDAGEVARLRAELYADGVIDREEAEFLFELNDAVSGRDNAPEWADFFVDALVKHLLDDPDSPGAVDGAEARWLKEKIGADGAVDGVERRLLEALRAKAGALPGELAALL